MRTDRHTASSVRCSAHWTTNYCLTWEEEPNASECGRTKLGSARWVRASVKSLRVLVHGSTPSGALSRGDETRSHISLEDAAATSSRLHAFGDARVCDGKPCRTRSPLDSLAGYELDCRAGAEPLLRHGHRVPAHAPYVVQAPGPTDSRQAVSSSDPPTALESGYGHNAPDVP